MSVVEAVARDLELIRKASPELADSALAATALVLARELDTPGNSATSKAMCAGRLFDVMGELRELAPPASTSDGIDELAARVAAKRAGGAAA